MDIHSPKIKGQATLDEAATYEQPLNLVPRQFVEQKASGFVVVRDIVPSDDSGLVGVKEYLAKTIPSNFALERCRTNTGDIRIMIECEPDRSQIQNFGVTVNGTPAQLDAVAGNSRLYTGYADIQIDTTAEIIDVEVVSTTGQKYSCEVIPAMGAPEIYSATFELPVGQTHAKANDEIIVTALVQDAETTSCQVIAGGASAGAVQLELIDDPNTPEGQLTYLGIIRCSEIAVDSPITLVATNYLGAQTEVPYVSANVPIDQQAPIIPNPTYAYPNGQQAFKDGDVVAVTSAITEADSVQYNVHQGFTVADPTVLENTKQVTLVTGEAANFDNDYYVIQARKSSNGSQTTKSFTLPIANEAPRINVAIVNNPARLRTDADGVDYKVRIISNQPLLQVPTMDAEVGEWRSAWVKKNDSTYERTIRVKDSDPRGTHNFINLLATGLAKVESTAILSGSEYTIGGFLMREVVVPALSQKVAIGAQVAIANKVVAYYKDADKLTYRPNLDNARASFSLVNAAGEFDANGDHLWISDAAFAGTNTSGTLTLTVEEVQ